MEIQDFKAKLEQMHKKGCQDCLFWRDNGKVCLIEDIEDIEDFLEVLEKAEQLANGGN